MITLFVVVTVYHARRWKLTFAAALFTFFFCFRSTNTNETETADISKHFQMADASVSAGFFVWGAIHATIVVVDVFR